MSTQSIRNGASDDAGPSDAFIPASLATIVADRFNIGHLLANYVRYRAIRRAEKELMALDDRMLNDIGLRRSEIGSAVRNSMRERVNGSRFATPLSC